MRCRCDDAFRHPAGRRGRLYRRLQPRRRSGDGGLLGRARRHPRRDGAPPLDRPLRGARLVSRRPRRRRASRRQRLWRDARGAGSRRGDGRQRLSGCPGADGVHPRPPTDQADRRHHYVRAEAGAGRVADRRLGLGERKSSMTLELDDIQHILLTRTPALTGRYLFVSFRDAAAGRAWLKGLLPTVRSAAAVGTSEADRSWVTIALTWAGMRALGLGEEALASFPDAFRQGMAAWAAVLGDTGRNAPEHWVDGTNRPDLHAIAILFARDADERGRCEGEHDKLLGRCPGVELISSLELEATPPFDYAHDHFGYRDRLSQQVIEGSEDIPYNGCGGPLKAGEFILGYPDESGQPYSQPTPT